MKWVKAMAALLAAVLLSGCRWIPITDLSDRAIVQGVGVDWADGEYVVTMQVFSPEGSGGQTIVDPANENAKIITCRGATVAQAVAESARDQAKEFYLGHNRIVILGGGTWERPLEETLSYFGNSPDARLDVTLLTTPGKASDILDVGISQTILPAMSIENTVRNAQRSGLSAEVLLVDAVQALTREYRGAVIPVIQPVEKENSEDRDMKAVELTGIALFSRSRQEGVLEGAAARGFLFLRDEIESVVYPVETRDYQRAAVELYRSRTRIVPELSGDRLRFRVEVRAEGMLVEKALREGGSFSIRSLEGLEREVEGRIQADCREAWQKSGVEARSDVFSLGDRVRNRRPDLWRSLEGGWRQRLDGIELVYDIHVDVNRTGMQALTTAEER